jgi:integrase
LIALAQYNNSPWNVGQEKLTLAELYELWSEKKLPKLGTSSQRAMKTAYKYCESLSHMKYRDIRSFHMQDTIDNCGYGYSTQGAIKGLWSHLDRFALELDIINKSYSQLTTAEPIPVTSKSPFTDAEVGELWQSQNKPWVDSIIVFLYTGWRISELLDLRKDDVDLTIGTMKGGVKSRAGKGRIVPIHSKIEHIIHKRYSESSEYLFEYDGGQCPKQKYYTIWNDVMQAHGMKHTPHECRHTFRTRLDKVNANRVAVNKIMGHSGSDVGEKTYTHKTIQELKDAIELITD